MASSSKWQIVLKVGVEGGSLTVFGVDSGGGQWKFSVERDESTLASMLSEEDLGGLRPSDFRGKSKLLETLDDALRHMDRYPWHRFYPVRIHPDFLEQVLEAVRLRGGDVESWKRILARHA